MIDSVGVMFGTICRVDSLHIIALHFSLRDNHLPCVQGMTEERFAGARVHPKPLFQRRPKPGLFLPHSENTCIFAFSIIRSIQWQRVFSSCKRFELSRVPASLRCLGIKKSNNHWKSATTESISAQVLEVIRVGLRSSRLRDLLSASLPRSAARTFGNETCMTYITGPCASQATLST